MADFSGGDITSDGGLLLIREIDELYRISERLSACFRDQRDASRVQHELKTLIAQRLYGLVQGYEDLNDHDDLRHERLFGVVLGQLESSHSRCAPLAGKSTLNRLEQAMHVSNDLTGFTLHQDEPEPGGGGSVTGRAVYRADGARAEAHHLGYGCHR